MNLLRLITRSRFLSPKRKLELYPPFWLMRVKVLELSPDWRHLRVRLPLNMGSRNMGGGMFGGYQASLADPVAALACARVFPGYSVWTRNMKIDFHREGNTHLELVFDFDPDVEEQIREDLKTKGRSNPTFEYHYELADGTPCTTIHNTVAIRPRGYKKEKNVSNGAYW
jgi:acyl-coenzyme A thioesterase PaaI-like protein